MRRATSVLALVLLALLLAFRTFVSGWGPPAHPPLTPATSIGIAAYPADNLSYSAWAQQAKAGFWRFSILYTTTEHERLMFNSLFLVIGWLAAYLAVSPLLVLNVLAAVALPVFVLSVSRLGRILGLSDTASLVAVCLAIGGGGISWARSVLHRFTAVGERGPDLSFYDLYPVTAYFIAPYHAISLALAAVLALMIVQSDDAEKPLRAPTIAVLLGSALFLATARPHITILVLTAYGAVVAATVWRRLPSPLRRRRLLVAVGLAAVMVPPVAYSSWVSQQPVWRAFSQAHRPITYDWATGFLVLWILAGAGVAIVGPRILRSPFAFLGAWALLAGALLLVVNGFIHPKLTAGSTIALGVFAGAAVDAYRARLHSRPAARAVLVAALAFLALASPTLLVWRHITERTQAPSELLTVIDTIGDDATTASPTVLVDCGTGVLLPGLSGYRVFCGHWSLTDNNRPKIALLGRLGFVADGQTAPAVPGVADDDIAMSAETLRRQLAANTFQYVVVRKRYRIARDLLPTDSGCMVFNGEEYLVLRMCSDVKMALERRIPL